METTETIISLRSYAAALAALGAGLTLSRALAHAEIAPATWDEASAEWQERIDESAATDLGLLVAFDAALLAEKRAFEPRLSPLDEDVEAFAHFRRHVLLAVDAVAFLAEHGVSLSRYARLEADWAARLLSDEALAASMKRYLEQPLPTCPRVTLTPSPLLEAAPAKAPSPAEAPSLPASPPPALGEGLPLLPLPLPVVESHVQAPSVVLARRDAVGMTGEIDLALIRAALPFAREADKAAAAPIVEPLPSLGARDIDKTGVLPADLMAKIAQGALPFAAGKGPLPLASPAPEPVAPKKAAIGSMTGALPALRSIEPALPFQGSASPPEMSLERYASLCAELSVSPAESEAIFTRHGLGVMRERLAVDLRWQEHLRRSPDEYRKWQELYQRYRAHWAEQRKPSSP
jgi:hypothetical protein